MKRSALALAGIALCGSLGAAQAEIRIVDGKRAKLFPLSSSGLPRSLKGAPAELSRVLARSLGAETANIPIEDAADMIECRLTDRSCLESIARSVGVKKIIFGRLEPRDDGAMVKLTTFEAGKGESQRSIAITGKTVDAMSDSLGEALDEGTESKTEGKKEPDEPLVPLDTTPTPPPAGGPTTGTWAMIIGGGLTAGAGVGFYLSARNLSKQVNAAPNETSEQIQQIIALEKAGIARERIGYGLMAVGGLVTTIGVIRYVVQKKSQRAEQPRFDVVPEQGGATVRFTMGWH